MTACREYQGVRDKYGYGLVPYGPQTVNRLTGHRAGRRSVRLHRWVMEQFAGRPLRAGEVVMHTCDNPPCFLFDHLVLATQLDNIADREAKGRGVQLVGEEHGNAKLTEADVIEIRRLHAAGTSQRALARQFGVTRQNIRSIVRRLTWRHI